MNTETGHIASFVTEEVPAGYVPIPDDAALQRRCAGLNRAQRRRYARLVRRGVDMRSAIDQVAA